MKVDLFKHSFDDYLYSWSELCMLQQWRGILIGNGASLAVCEKFKYDSLFEIARSTNQIHQLCDAELSIFERLHTQNFEVVLEAVSKAALVCDAIGEESLVFPGLYSTIQYALFEAVYHGHPEHWQIDKGVLQSKRRALTPYKHIFSTNYDLLLYWAIMSAPRQARIKDYFWSGLFDRDNVAIKDGASCILYLHGGIHLAKLPSGETIKRRCSWETGTLLESLWASRDDGAIPLFVTEGKSSDKVETIQRSDYLSFAFEQLKEYKGPLTVFGHSLGESDRHLLEVMRSWGDRSIAISMRPAPPSTIRSRKAELRAKLPDANLYYYDSTTHPLGALPSLLQIQEDSSTNLLHGTSFGTSGFFNGGSKTG